MLGGWDTVWSLRDKFSRYIYWGSMDETSPIARSEWIEIFGILVGNVQTAQQISDRVNASYSYIRNQVTSKVTTRPKVFSGRSFNIRGEVKWVIPGGRSDEARLLRDAGADYILNTNESSNVVFSNAEGLNFLKQSEYWFDPMGMCYSRIEEFLGYNNELGSIELVQKSNIYLQSRRSDCILFIYFSSMFKK